jgi:hypothetical protein
MMMKLLTLFILIIVSNFTLAQRGEKGNFYTDIGLQLGNYIGFDFSGNYIIKDNYTINAGIFYVLRKNDDRPEDYSGEFLNFGFNAPYDQLISYRIGAGRLYKLNAKGTIRLHLAVGIGLTIIKEPSNYVFLPDADSWSQNYSWNYESKNVIGLTLNPKLEFPFTKYFGLSLSPLIHLTTSRTYYGVSVSYMVGML